MGVNDHHIINFEFQSFSTTKKTKVRFYDSIFILSLTYGSGSSALSKRETFKLKTRNAKI